MLVALVVLFVVSALTHAPFWLLGLGALAFFWLRRGRHARWQAWQAGCVGAQTSGSRRWERGSWS